MLPYRMPLFGKTLPKRHVHVLVVIKFIQFSKINSYTYRAVISGGAGGALVRNLGVLLTLFQPEGADYAHHNTAK